MTTFTEWKKLPPVRGMITALVGDIGLDNLLNWRAYKQAIWHADHRGIQDRASNWACTHEREEIVAFAAVLWTMDNSKIANEVCRENDIHNVFSPINRMDDVHRRIVAGAFEMADRNEEAA
jgi:hypothetical protein